MKTINEYKKDLKKVNDFLVENKDDIIFLQLYLSGYENDETYQGLLKERKQLKEIKLWLENKLENYLEMSNK
jgi:hypothetical protein